MKNALKPLALAAAIAGLSVLSAAPGFARGGGDIMNSPGYQRALQNEHKAYLRTATEPVVVIRTHERHRPKHRH
jgi:hypothetical protein